MPHTNFSAPQICIKQDILAQIKIDEVQNFMKGIIIKRFTKEELPFNNPHDDIQRDLP